MQKSEPNPISRKHKQSDLAQMSLLSEATPSHVLPTNVTTRRHPVHRWYNFIAGFSPEFVRECLGQVGPQPTTRIIDPFNGCATTLVEANFAGIESVGVEAHLFMAKVSRGKLSIGISPKDMDLLEEKLISCTKNPDHLSRYSGDAITFLRKLVPEDSLISLSSARESIQVLDRKLQGIAYLVLSKALDLCSHSKTDGIYKAPTSTKKAVEFAASISMVCDMLRQDLAYVRRQGITNRATLLEQSSESIPQVVTRSCDLLVTSPPYLNNFDYAEMTRMQLYFWLHAANWGEVTTNVRSKLIVNTTTALKGHKDRIGHYRENTPASIRAELDRYQFELAERKSGKNGKKDYDFLIYPYFSQMTSVLREASRVLKANAPAHIIVSDAALYGVHIKTQEVLAQIMEDLGFKEVQILKLRSRGTRWILEKREGAAEGLGEYHIRGFAPRAKNARG